MLRGAFAFVLLMFAAAAGAAARAARPPAPKREDEHPFGPHHVNVAIDVDGRWWRVRCGDVSASGAGRTHSEALEQARHVADHVRAWRIQ